MQRGRATHPVPHGQLPRPWDRFPRFPLLFNVPPFFFIQSTLLERPCVPNNHNTILSSCIQPCPHPIVYLFLHWPPGPHLHPCAGVCGRVLAIHPASSHQVRAFSLRKLR